jgi:TnpA family transposase
MSTHIKIISNNEKKAFDFPPIFSDKEREHFFDIPEWAKELLNLFRTTINKVGFIIQLGYFRAANKFFEPKRFYQQDIEFVTNMMNYPVKEIRLEKYIHTTYERHQSIILNNLGFRRFDEKARNFLEKEAFSLSTNQIKPRSIFLSLVDFLRSKKIEVPSYYAISQIITDVLKSLEQNILNLIEKHVSEYHKKILDNLLSVSEEYLTEDKEDLKLKRYKISLLKKNSQSTRPSKIRENIIDLQCLRELFVNLQPAIQALDLSPEIVQYYAQVVIKSQIFQIARRDSSKYLYLISFVIYQYFRLNDLLVDTLIQSVQSAINTALRDHKEEFYKKRHYKHQNIKQLSENVSNHLNILYKINEIIRDNNLSDKEKVDTIRSLLNEEEDRENIKEQLESLEKDSNRVIKDNDYYDVLELKSLKLQNRASPIIKELEFDNETSNAALIKAINYFKKKEGSLGFDAPIEFLDGDQSKVIFDESGKLRVSLYKVMLFEHISDAIKSGALNLIHSYKFKAFEDYLIPKALWETEKYKLLEHAGLVGFENFDKIEPELKKAINEQFQITNNNITYGKNKHAKFDSKNNIVVSTPKTEKVTLDPMVNLFPKDRIIPIFEVLSTVNNITNFIDCFEHYNIKYIRNRPTSNIFLAGITGYGCNLGVRKIAKISRNISQNELEHVVNWYFNNDNIIDANDKIMELTAKLQLSNLFKKSKNITHTSSDGQKYNIHVESLNANYSYKYFGKGKGVTVYVFIDESHRLFYSVVISSAESEAAYVIDGLMHNDVVQSDIHSTDTAGYSEIIFCVCHLLGISFAPRIKNFKDQQLYSFDKPSALKALDYRILPDGRINTQLICDNWDDILRFIVTIKSRRTPASQLFRRLSSYSRQHPLYKALKEFGKILKTLFLLKYIDDVALRQAIEKQLNKQENTNKLAKAVFYGNNQEFQQGTKEEQLIAEGCKRLIENSIICWNYLYLSQLIHDSEKEEEKQNLILTMKNGSVVVWHHINIHGEYDFSDEYLKDSIEFKLQDLLNVKIV